MKILFLIVSALLLSNFVAAECFLFQDNNFYCTDIPLQQAQSECALYPDCNPAIHISSTPCQAVSSCQTTLPLPVIAQQDAQQEAANEPPINVRQDAVDELPIIDKAAAASKLSEGTSPLWWILLSLIVLAVAVYYAYSKNLIPQFWLKLRVDEFKEGPSVIFEPLRFNPRKQKKIQALQKSHQKKAHQHEIKAFLAEAGLAIADTPKDIFSQLQSLNRVLEKKKHKLRRLSQYEQKAFENLEEIIHLSKTKWVGKVSPVNPQEIKKDIQKAIDDLRTLLGKSKP